MFDRRFLDITRPIQHRIATALISRNVRADHLTIAGFAIGMLALPLIAIGQPLWALLFILLNRLFDGLDGTVARLTQPTDRGGFLDIVLDFLFYSSIPLGFAIASPEHNALAGATLIYAFIGTGCSFLAFAIIAAKRNMDSTEYPDKGFYYLGGLTEATETISVFALMCLFPSGFAVLAYGFAALCLLSTFLRIRAGMEMFS